MAVIIVGGHSRSVGKTSVVAGIVAGLRGLNWTAMKITQFGHGFCTADGAPCDCATDEHTVAFSVERGLNPGTDTARYLAAGAVKSLWMRARQGNLAPAMSRIRKEIAAAENVIIESNSVMQFLRPDLYLTVLDHATADFKPTARLFLDRADAVLVHSPELTPHWQGVSLKLLEGKQHFQMVPPEYVTDELLKFVSAKLSRFRSKGEPAVDAKP